LASRLPAAEVRLTAGQVVLRSEPEEQDVPAVPRPEG
jgi:hypothetical protein